MKELKNKIYNKVGIKSDRTKNITKHVLFSFIYKGGSILSSFLLVPLTINYLDTENYGVWLTLSSFIAWVSFFDVGLGNGLRNKFAEAKAYVSSAYFTIGAVSLGLVLVFFSVNIFVDWTIVFNCSDTLQKDLSVLMPIVFGFFCLQLVVKLITTIYTADQRHSTQGDHFLITIGHMGDPKVRIKFFQNVVMNKGILPVIISPLAYVSKYAIVNGNVEIDENCFIGSASVIKNNKKHSVRSWNSSY